MLLMALALIGLGLLGIARSETLAGGESRFVVRQAVWAGVGLMLMLAVSVPNYRLLCPWSYVALAVSLVLLVVVYWFPAVNGAHRWIRLGGIGLQPSEFAKVAFVLALARYLRYRENFRRLRGLLLPLGIAFLPVTLILREPDLGTAMVFLPVFFLMLVAAGARWRDLATVALVGLLALPVLWTQMSREQKSRVTSLLDQTAPGQTPDDDQYHLHRAKRMTALGGVWGSAVSGQRVEDFGAYRLPHAHTDFIFCVLGERFGLVGLGVVLTLYAALVWRGLAVAHATREPFGRLLAVGLAGMLAVQVLINTAMTVGLLPITGLSLPLVSYGGSNMVAHCLAIGLLSGIALRPGYEMTNEPFRHTAR